MQKLRLPTKEEIEIYSKIKMDEKKHFYETLDELKGVSPIASLKLPLIKSTSVSWHTTYEDYEDFFEGDGFHPNGDCGCFKARDNYMCGIRCDHLIVIDGSTEEEVMQNEKSVWFDVDKCDLLPDEKEYYNTHELFIKSKPAILVIGNHKGSLVMTKYVFAPSKTLTKCSIWYADIVRFANTKNEEDNIRWAIGDYKNTTPLKVF